VTDCPYCKALDETNIRKAMMDKKPLYAERIEMVGCGWYRYSETKWAAKFFCDACTGWTEIIVELTDEPDPSDWWKV